MKPLKQQQFSDPALALLVSNLREWSDQFKNIPILDGKLIENVSISTSGAVVSHTLGRVPRGWFVVNINAAVDILQISANDRTLTLDANGSAIISLWVF